MNDTAIWKKINPSATMMHAGITKMQKSQPRQKQKLFAHFPHEGQNIQGAKAVAPP
jgi:hypothetical protein